MKKENRELISSVLILAFGITVVGIYEAMVGNMSQTGKVGLFIVSLLWWYAWKLKREEKTRCSCLEGE